MREIFLNQKIFIYSLKEAQDIKLTLLNEIEKMPNHSFDTVTKTDWHIKDIKRIYWKIFFPFIKKPLNKIASSLYCRTWTIDNYWFQQYEKNSKHDWHTHGNTNYAFVYFLEARDEHITKFIDTEKDKIFSVPAKEGDLIAFPAHLPHKSEINTQSRKTVIAFNVSFNLGDT